jgi:hypothetical protein
MMADKCVGPHNCKLGPIRCTHISQADVHDGCDEEEEEEEEDEGEQRDEVDGSIIKPVQVFLAGCNHIIKRDKGPRVTSTPDIMYTGKATHTKRRTNKKKRQM